MLDSLLPPAAQIRPDDYKGSGYYRGQLCPPGDRGASAADEQATFVMSNVLPQTGDLKRHAWEDLEEYCRDRVRQGNELYIIAGGYGSRGAIAEYKVNVPARWWKVIVELPEGEDDLHRIGPDTRVIAVDMPNLDGVANRKWPEFVVTPHAIEVATGYTFFGALPTAVRTALELKQDTGPAPTRQPLKEPRGVL
jgi:endonuclease G